MTEETVTTTEEVDAIPAPQPTEQEAPKEEPKEEVEAEEQAPEKEKLAKVSYENRRLKRQNREISAKNNEISEKLDSLMQMMQQKNQPEAPKLDQFETVEDYMSAAFKHLRMQEQDSVKEKQEPDPTYVDFVESSREDLFELGTEKYEDFEEVVLGENVEITPVMRDVIFNLDDEVKADVAYYLGKNPKESHRISKLHPIRQAAEIGKIEAKVSQPKKQTRTSTAPEPIQPVGGGATPSDEIQEQEDYKSFLKKRNKQLGR